MDKVLTVAVREFLATVRTRAFLLTVVMMPGLIIAGVYGSQWFMDVARKDEVPLRTVAVVDHTGFVLPALESEVERYNTERPKQPFKIEELDADTADTTALNQRVAKGELYGYVVISPDAIIGNGGCEFARRDSQLEPLRTWSDMLERAVIAIRFEDAGVAPAQLQHLHRGVPIHEVNPQTGQAMKDNMMARIMTPFAFMFLLFMGTFGISQGLLTSLIEEKSSRVIELLLSAVSPFQLMAGKILGTALVGFVLLTVWGGVGSMAAHKYHLEQFVDAYRIFIAVLYFIPGFLLMSALLAAIGASCSQLKDAQSMVFPLSAITIIPMMCWYAITDRPDSVLAMSLSFIPPITPFVMVLRICADPDTPMWQIVATLGLLWASVVVAMWAAAKVFRVGVLMYGKAPTPMEMLRWVRYA